MKKWLFGVDLFLCGACAVFYLLVTPEGPHALLYSGFGALLVCLTAGFFLLAAIITWRKGKRYKGAEPSCRPAECKEEQRELRHIAVCPVPDFFRPPGKQYRKYLYNPFFRLCVIL